MQYLYRPNECQMTFQETGARQVYGIDCYRRDRKDAPPVAQYLYWSSFFVTHCSINN